MRCPIITQSTGIDQTSNTTPSPVNNDDDDDNMFMTVFGEEGFIIGVIVIGLCACGAIIFTFVIGKH